MFNAFNDYFSSTGTKLANNIPCTSANNSIHRGYVRGTSESFEFHPTNSREVFKLLNKLNKLKRAGLDKIPTRIIGECSDLISPYNTIIFNLSSSLSTGVFPDDWKSANVTPTFK